MNKRKNPYVAWIIFMFFVLILSLFLAFIGAGESLALLVIIMVVAGLLTMGVEHGK